MLFYYLGYFNEQQQQNTEALQYFHWAELLSTDHCFSNRLEDIAVLQAAIGANPKDAKAWYYLGNLWYDKRQYKEAIECWESSATLDVNNPTTFRNLALAYYNKHRQKERALQNMFWAYKLNENDSRILMELDQLYKLMGTSFHSRLELLEDHWQQVEQRDDLYLERVTLYNNLRQFETAKELLARRKFNPWEGGEGKVIAQFLLCHLELAKEALTRHEYQQALTLLDATIHYPENLGEGKLYGCPENERLYWTGCAYAGLGLTEMAKSMYLAATQGNSEPAQAIFYNDPQPDAIFFQALAWMQLGEPDMAKKIFENFITFGETHINASIHIDYFAVSLPDMLVFDKDIDLSNKVHCLYLVGLGWLGLGNTSSANQFLQEVLQLDINHQGAMRFQRMLPFFENLIARLISKLVRCFSLNLKHAQYRFAFFVCFQQIIRSAAGCRGVRVLFNE